MDNNRPLTDREKWQQAERLLRDMSRECAKMNGDIHDLRAELTAIRETLAVADAKLSRLSQLADKWDDRGGYAKSVFAKDLRNVLAGTVCGGPRPMLASPEPQAPSSQTSAPFRPTPEQMRMGVFSEADLDLDGVDL